MGQYCDPSWPSSVASGVPRVAAVCLIAGGLLAPAAPAWSAVPANAATAQGSTPTLRASFAHSGLKTLTYEVGNALNNFGFLTLGAGGLGAGLLLTGFNTVQSWTVYTANDYLWERFNPPQANTDGTGVFDAKQSLWRTTLKYMTGKPVVASIKIAALYVYTGSAATAFGYGLAATAGASVVFFVNNIAWDYYDQMVACPQASKPDPLSMSTTDRPAVACAGSR